MPRRVTVLLLAFAAVTSVHAQGVRVKLTAWPAPVLLDTLRQDHSVAADPQVVYAAVQKAFAELELPVGNTDSQAGIIGTDLFERRGRLAGAAMARSFNCGDSPMGAPNADTFRLSIAVAAWVKPDGKGGTILGLAAAADGLDASGARRGAHECTSTGELEGKIVAAVTRIAR